MIPSNVQQWLEKTGIEKLRPAQNKSIAKGLFKGKNLLVCTPTASGKTLIAEMQMLETISKGKKAVYVVPLRALASEKYKSISKKHSFRTALSTGELDKTEDFSDSDAIIVTAEKLDSLCRHQVSWLKNVGLLVVDEIHLLNDPNRGPTLEILITMLRKLSNPQLLALSATIGNPEELAGWLKAELVQDDWRPVKLKKGIALQGGVRFPK